MAWLLAAGITTAVFVALLTLRFVLQRYAQRVRATREREFFEVPTEVLSRTTLPFFLMLSVYAGLRVLTLGDRLQALANSAVTIAFFWQAGIWMMAAVRVLIARRRE